MDVEKKLSVLSKIGKALNENNIVWAVGGSLLLYLKGKADVFQDIDIMAMEDHIKELKKILQQYGDLELPNPNVRYKTRHFLEFTIDEVDVDVMAGFVIIHKGKEYDCSLHPESITEHLLINDVYIPLQSLTEWRRYYALMGRTEKVEMIDR
ncbi:hypothetical protein Desde_2338 [Desulfitobacterium dehalogenans ATCC 51507]|uniref:Nucleotidyltransferase family protein n=2 Tax=Desulfitobacterium dehalogenans TaxID=36854 RepID=I4A9P2_DESDJ|nr:hypothetical protein Desde_2338 [Desulfitobacterium dehalogenans ATCC 51507]